MVKNTHWGPALVQQDPELEVEPPGCGAPRELKAPQARSAVVRGTSLLAVVAAATVVTVGCGGSSAAGRSSASVSPAKVTIGGQLSLHSVTGVSHPQGDSQPCAGTGGYDDIQPGIGVTVKDAHGTVIGLGQLEQGFWHAADYTCVFDWSATVPPSDFYQVTVSHRGDVTFPAATATADHADLTLGDG